MIQIAETVIPAILAAARNAHPHECCGILLGGENRVESYLSANNIHPNPETHFEIDPRALIAAHKAERAGGPQVVGYYHSHPTGDPAPSATDRASAAHDGKVWAIVAGDEVAFFRDGDERFEALSYAVLPR